MSYTQQKRIGRWNHRSSPPKGRKKCSEVGKKEETNDRKEGRKGKRNMRKEGGNARKEQNEEGRKEGTREMACSDGRKNGRWRGTTLLLFLPDDDPPFVAVLERKKRGRKEGKKDGRREGSKGSKVKKEGQREDGKGEEMKAGGRQEKKAEEKTKERIDERMGRIDENSESFKERGKGKGEEGG